MIALISGTLARAAAIAVLTGASLIIADAASAEPIFLSGSHSHGEIMGACAAAGGTYQDNGKSGSGGQYGCVTEKGTVTCDDGGGKQNCGGNCEKCADVAPKKGGVTPGRGSSAGNASGAARSPTASSKLNSFPLKKVAGHSMALRHATHVR